MLRRVILGWAEEMWVSLVGNDQCDEGWWWKEWRYFSGRRSIPMFPQCVLPDHELFCTIGGR